MSDSTGKSGRPFTYRRLITMGINHGYRAIGTHLRDHGIH